MKCRATVTEKSGVLNVSNIDHCHQPVVGALALTKMKVAFKERAQAEPFSSTPLILDDALDTHVNTSNLCELPNPKSLYRTANNTRDYKKSFPVCKDEILQVTVNEIEVLSSFRYF